MGAQLKIPILNDFYPNALQNWRKIIILGAAGGSTIRKLADATMKNDYLGIMVWYASVKNGLQYAETWDASSSEDTIEAYLETGKRFRAASK